MCSKCIHNLLIEFGTAVARRFKPGRIYALFETKSSYCRVERQGHVAVLHGSRRLGQTSRLTAVLKSNLIRSIEFGTEDDVWNGP